jgi:molybdopterin-guanine dinucleotide biosynthesis protein A
VFALVRRSNAPALRAFLNSGGRAMHRWLETLGAVEVPFDYASAFRNLNAPADSGIAGAERSA